MMLPLNAETYKGTLQVPNLQRPEFRVSRNNGQT